MTQTRAVAIIIAVWALACFLAPDADAGPTPDSCPPGLLSDPDNDSQGVNCICESGEGIGYVSTGGEYRPFAVDAHRVDADGDCATDPRPVPSADPGAGGPHLLPPLIIENTDVYPVPDAAPAGPVAGEPTFTG